MKVTDDDFAEGQRRARARLAGLSEDDQWLMLEHMMTGAVESEWGARYGDPAPPTVAFTPRDEAHRQMMVVMELEMVRSELYPTVTLKQWQKLGWSRALRNDPPGAAATFIHRTRLAKATGSLNGRL